MAKDFVYALRAIRKSPQFAVIAIVTLAIGIGANTAIFTLLNAIVLRPLPVPHPEQLIALRTTIPDSGNGDQPLSLRMFEEIGRQNRIFSHLFAYQAGGVTNFDAARSHHVAELASVSGDYYETLQVVPLRGRFIADSDVALNSGISPKVAVISFRAWRDWFNSSIRICFPTTAGSVAQHR
ncbi:MAG: ABC transporter permease [Acidobacteriaceae bacterium]|nr:ABC transporter permease [Acidobacteriaceae bacterium]MBV9778963.1 ABC transporter permease [Acidobacteriaceae bacterium]